MGRACATHDCTHTGASTRDSQRGRDGWEGGREVLAQEDLDAVRDQRCPVPAQPLWVMVLGLPWVQRDLEVEGPIQNLLNDPVWPLLFSSVRGLLLQEDGFQEWGSVPVLMGSLLSALTVTQDISDLPLQHGGQETSLSSVLSPYLLWHWDDRDSPQYRNSIGNFIHSIFPELWSHFMKS